MLWASHRLRMASHRWIANHALAGLQRAEMTKVNAVVIRDRRVTIREIEKLRKRWTSALSRLHSERRFGHEEGGDKIPRT